MQSTLNEPEPEVWNQIAPFLDEALNCLREKDHDAVVLRFFYGKKLKEVGEAMGIGEDAARMRVNRGLETLRKFFARKGVSLSTSAIAGTVAANSLQAAPVGLALAITAAALSGQAVSSTAFIAATKSIAMTTLQKTIIAGLVVAAGGTGLYQALQILQLNALNEKQQQKSSAEQILNLNRDRNRLAAKLAEIRDDKELQRLRKEHLELMSLRGRVRQLTDELRQIKNAEKETRPTANSASEPNTADSILFSASLTNRLSTGQTLVVGGWSMEGKRGYLLLTPSIQQNNESSDGQPLAIQSQMVSAPETFWDQIGWGDAKSDARRSTVAGILTPDQLNTLVMVLKATDGSNLSNTSLAKRADGEYVGLGFAKDDNHGGSGMMMGIDLYPRIGADNQSVVLEMHPSTVSSNIDIHPSLVAPK